jgi:hypothetical protein
MLFTAETTLRRFELMLRMKANYLWPGMLLHETPFFIIAIILIITQLCGEGKQLYIARRTHK